MICSALYVGTAVVQQIEWACHRRCQHHASGFAVRAQHLCIHFLLLTGPGFMCRVGSARNQAGVRKMRKWTHRSLGFKIQVRFHSARSRRNRVPW